MAVVGLLLGCGLSYEDFERAVDLAVEQGTVRMEGEVVVSERGPDGEEDEFRVAMSGALDLRADRGEITMVFAGIEDEPVPSPCRMVTDGDVDYLEVADGWLRTDLSGLDGTDASPAADPREAFELLRAVFGDVEGIGFEDVRGVRTRRWRVHVDVDRLLEAEGHTPAQGWWGSLGRRRMPMDVWIDTDGLLRRIELSVHERVAGTSVEMWWWTDLFDYGEPLTIALPDPAQVRDEDNPLLALFACMGADYP